MPLYRIVATQRQIHISETYVEAPTPEAALALSSEDWDADRFVTRNIDYDSATFEVEQPDPDGNKPLDAD